MTFVKNLMKNFLLQFLVITPCVTKMNLLDIYRNIENEIMESVLNNYILIQYLNNFM